ncbi:hypothetical protein KIS4809_5499 [Bacillus sp. ZZV12-4809]|nr:hypothetical protein KIS4809_5499 [Bacillus sp. ZZV12-4809]
MVGNKKGLGAGEIVAECKKGTWVRFLFCRAPAPGVCRAGGEAFNIY